MSFIRLGATGAPTTPGQPNHLVEDTTAFKDIGFDLDGVCTSSTTCAQADGGVIQEEHCYRPPSPIGGKVGAIDGNGCSDNAVGSTIPISYFARTTSEWYGVNENDWNCELHRGGFGVMFRIRNYNGTPNDPKVLLDVYNTMGITSTPTWTCRENPSDVAARPDWRGQPGWRNQATSLKWRFARSNWDPADDTSPNTLPDSKVHTEEAYVKDGYLVAFLPKASSIGFIGGHASTSGIRLTFERGILAGRLVQNPTDQRWSLKDATLGGAVDPDTMLKSFEHLGFCADNMCGSYNAVDTVLTGVRDIYLDPDREAAPENPMQPCDGMSIGMALEAEAARGDDPTKEDDPWLADCPEPLHPVAKLCRCSSATSPADCSGDGGLGGTGGTGGSGGTAGDGG